MYIINIQLNKKWNQRPTR